MNDEAVELVAALHPNAEFKYEVMVARNIDDPPQYQPLDEKHNHQFDEPGHALAFLSGFLGSKCANFRLVVNGKSYMVRKVLGRKTND